MARKIEWSERAVGHLTDIADFIGTDSQTLAALTVSRIMARIDQVSEFPQSGRIVPEYQNPNLREVFWQDYRIVYLVSPERIVVIAVAHGSAGLEKFLHSLKYL